MSMTLSMPDCIHQCV